MVMGIIIISAPDFKFLVTLGERDGPAKRVPEIELEDADHTLSFRGVFDRGSCNCCVTCPCI